MHIYVNKSFPRQTIKLDVRAQDTINDVKDKIQAQEGISVEQQCLVFAGTCYDNGLKLQDCEIRDESVLYLVICFSRSIEIFVSTLPGNVFALQVLDNDPVIYVKERIEEIEGIDAAEQIVTFCGMEMENGKVLSDYNILHGSCLKVMLKDPDFVTNLDDVE